MSDAIDTTNRFLVGMSGDGLVILGSARLLRGPITPDDALNLAAHLVVLAGILAADDCDERFCKIVKEIRNT